MTNEKTIETREDFNEGELKNTSADRDDHSGDLGIGYPSAESNVETSMPGYNNIVLQVRFDKDQIGEGDTVTEYSENNWDLTTQNDLEEFSQGVFSTQSFRFVDPNQRIISEEGVLDGADEATFVIWARFDDMLLDEENNPFFRVGDEPSSSSTSSPENTLGFTITFNEASNHGSALLFRKDGDFSDAPTIDIGNLEGEGWVMITGVWDGESVELYKNNELMDSSDEADDDAIPSDLIFAIGNADYDDNGETSDYKISEAIVFDKALSQSEIEQLYFDGHEDNNFEGEYESKELDELEGDADKITIDASVGSGETVTATVVSLDSEGDELDTSDGIDVEDGENTYDVENLSDGDSYRVDFDLEVDQ